jgi:hypothetical protein
MSRVGFEPTIPVFKRVKVIYALDRGECYRLVNHNHIMEI